ncbi:ParA family protein [Leptospira alstonii]|uniref:CobQ/CobB/MinD/ParA nucleotide binding domain protein n=1 Tax=Leptospira alstonii serovar Sichuan str. 79601 TaxID=1218565 RepID=M6CU49_9LEPT|nr:AAA family ATPase [Leptospira alstonii]AGS80471.1 CobQ/CobB/MinD/ParA nucleotide binding domain protein [Leptospira phage vB_LalZ_80412-LE1]EMJ95442.1 CobQ/CobB/MinD/ParA nucleotide binding domain protein [Leptospira alstonii serovar Sichuan str. 79601]
MAVFVISNPKGGSGKSTTGFHFIISLAKNSQTGRTLALDFDMQGDLTDAFFPDVPIEEFDEANTLTVIKGETSLNESIREIHGVDVLVASLELEDYGYFATKNQSLIPKIGSLVRNSSYEHVVIDTPGSGASEVISAFMGADYIIIPVKPTKWATRTIKRVLRKVNEAQDYINQYQDGRTLEVFIVPVQWGHPTSPSIRSIKILEQLRNYNNILKLLKEKEHGFELVKNPHVTDPIPYIQEMDDRTENGEPFKPNTKGSEYYERLVEEILTFHKSKISSKVHPDVLNKRLVH